MELLGRNLDRYRWDRSEPAPDHRLQTRLSLVRQSRGRSISQEDAWLVADDARQPEFNTVNLRQLWRWAGSKSGCK